MPKANAIAVRPGVRIGPWQLVRVLGQGEFGATWLAEDASGRRVAIKALREPPGDELRALCRVVHPAVVTVLGGGGEPFPHLVMEYVRGKTLAAYLRSGEAPVETAIGITARLADALDAMHRAGVVHGDLKPENVMVESMKAQRLKIIDFGLSGHALGGTLNYAAPERMRGGSNSPEADVYSVGLILWQMLHGQLPWADKGLSSALLKRQNAVPEPDVGEPWLRGMLGDLLAIEPSHRPSACELADRLIQRGATIEPPDSRRILGRSSSLHVMSDDLSGAVEHWLDHGGRLALVGPSGSGRSHLLDHVGRELQARATPWIRLDASSRSWTGIEDALGTAGLPGPPVPLPDIPEAEARARAAARQLRKRCPTGFAVLADDLHRMDEPSLLLLRELAGERVISICTAAPHAPEWADQRVQLRPLDRGALADLVRGLLGDLTDSQALVDRLIAVSAGLPGPSVAYVMHAIRGEALVWRARRWQIEPVRLAGLEAPESAHLHLEEGLGERARALGALIAVHEVPAAVDVLLHLAEMDEAHGRDALGELLDAGLVRVERGSACCRSEAAAAALRDLAGDVEPLHRKLAEHLLQTRADPVRLGWHTVGCGDRALAAKEGPRAVQAALALDGIVPKALLGAAIASAAIMPSDFVRRMLLADLRVELTTLLSFARFGAHFGVLLTAFLYDSVTLLLFYAAFAVGAAAVAGLGARSAFAGIRGHFRVDRSALAALYDFARWIVLKNVSRYALLNLAYWTLLIVTGLEAGARYTASWLVVAVMNILATGLSSFLTPYFSRLYENQRGVYGTRAMQALLVWTGGFLSMAVLVAIYSEALLELFYGGKYSDTLHVVRLWVVGSALTMIVIFCEIVLKSTRRPQEIWRLQLWSAIPVVPVIYPAVLYGGVVGALWCGVAQRLTMLLFVGGRVFTLLRSGVLAPPSSEPQPPGAGENR